MKTLLLAAVLAAVSVTSAQAEVPAVLKGVAKKQTLTSQQMRTVRGEGVGGCAPTTLAAKANVNAKVGVGCLANVKAKACVDAKVNVGNLNLGNVNLGDLGNLGNLGNLGLGNLNLGNLGLGNLGLGNLGL